MCWAVRRSTRPSAPLNGWSSFHYSKHLLLSCQTAFAAFIIMSDHVADWLRALEVAIDHRLVSDDCPAMV